MRIPISLKKNVSVPVFPYSCSFFSSSSSSSLRKIEEREVMNEDSVLSIILSVEIAMDETGVNTSF